MSGATTQITQLTGDQFAARIAELYPRGWCSDTAKQPGGNVYAMLLSVGNELSFIQTEIEYALNAQRINTETAPELDLASIDFLGNTLPRQPGLSDATFAAEIIAALFQPAATRAALQNALARLTGFVPRMMEPWNVNDTGAWGVAYWNVDTVANPARWSDSSLRYQGFIETPPPALSPIGPNNPVLCWGDSAYWDVPGYFFGIIPPVDLNAVDNLINRLRAYGTIVWFKIVSSSGGFLPLGDPPGTVGNLTAASTGPTSVTLSWTAPLTGTPPFTFVTLYRQTGTPIFSTGPAVSTTTATIANLSAGTQYDFEVVARNASGSSVSPIVTAQTSEVPPSPAQNLVATLVQATAVTLSWSPPAIGTPPFTYSINYRVTGTTPWQSFAVGRDATAVTVINLQPLTTYDFEVVTTNL